MLRPPEPATRRCQKCGHWFVSPDPERLRRCHGCKKDESVREPPGARVALPEGGARPHLSFQEYS